jgi:hypothetical protein
MPQDVFFSSCIMPPNPRQENSRILLLLVLGVALRMWKYWRLVRTTVVAGPVEATAMENLRIQARTMGDLPAGNSIRDVSAASSALQVYPPRSD